MGWEDVFGETGPIATRQELLWSGATGRDLTWAVRYGDLIRLRNGHYCLPGTEVPLQQAVRLGGRVACASLLGMAGAFVPDGAPHVHLKANAARLRSPDRRVPLTPRTRNGARTHWAPLRAEPMRWAVSVPDAIAQVAACLPEPLAVAVIDSALQKRLVRLPVVQHALRPAARDLIPLIDGRAESGSESVLRVALAHAGIPFEIQVEVPSVGRVDFVIAQQLIVEADSRAAHDGWDAKVKDHTRDLRAAHAGYPTFRPLYQHIMGQTDTVVDAIRRLLATLR